MVKRQELRGSVEEIAEAMRTQKEAGEYKRLQCVYLPGSRAFIHLAMQYPDMTAETIGKITQFSKSLVWAIHAKYRENGIEGLVDKRGGRYRENMTVEEESELLAGFEEQSESGRLIVAGKVKLANEAKAGKKVAESTIYRMLARHGYRKIVPYQRHPKSNQEEQEAFKKTFHKS